MRERGERESEARERERWGEGDIPLQKAVMPCSLYTRTAQSTMPVYLSVICTDVACTCHRNRRNIRLSTEERISEDEDGDADAGDKREEGADLQEELDALDGSNGCLGDGRADACARTHPQIGRHCVVLARTQTLETHTVVASRQSKRKRPHHFGSTQTKPRYPLPLTHGRVAMRLESCRLRTSFEEGHGEAALLLARVCHTAHASQQMGQTSAATVWWRGRMIEQPARSDSTNGSAFPVRSQQMKD